jgi:hypothetical protein
MAQSFEHAKAGDLVTITGHQVGDHARLGEILEVIGDREHVRLRARWEEDRETLFFPGSDASLQHSEQTR